MMDPHWSQKVLLGLYEYSIHVWGFGCFKARKVKACEVERKPEEAYLSRSATYAPSLLKEGGGKHQRGSRRGN